VVIEWIFHFEVVFDYYYWWRWDFIENNYVNLLISFIIIFIIKKNWNLNFHFKNYFLFSKILDFSLLLVLFIFLILCFIIFIDFIEPIIHLFFTLPYFCDLIYFLIKPNILLNYYFAYYVHFLFLKLRLNFIIIFIYLFQKYLLI
jgi:hypothetical protein